MHDLIPEEVLRIIRDRYLAGISEAEASFPFGQADEDALTGALGQAISMPTPLIYQTNNERYGVNIYYRKIRGRGRNAPEKRFGADGVFQIEVRDTEGQLLRRKGLPFQAKKEWSGVDRELVRQADSMNRELGGGLVIDYSVTGYSACTASSVVELDGSKQKVSDGGGFRRLGQMLAHDFLDCSIGVQELFYDVEDERFIIDLAYRGPVQHVVGTSVQRFR